MGTTFTNSNNLLSSILAVILFCASMSDLKTHKIPNMLTITAALFAITYHTVLGGAQGLSFSFIGFACGIALLVLPYLMGGMGAGDVKLMGAVGSFLGAKATLEAFILIALVGGVYSLFLILSRRDAFRGFFSEKLMVLSNMVLLKQYMPLNSGSSSQKPRLKYGVAIAFGTITYLLLKPLGIKFFS